MPISAEKFEKAKTMNVEPKWSDVADWCIHFLEKGTVKQKEYARDEIRKMGRICESVRKEQRTKRKKPIMCCHPGCNKKATKMPVFMGKKIPGISVCDEHYKIGR